MALAVPGAAHASTGVGMHGPATEAFGWFPEWFEDSSGMRLELCVDGPYGMATMESSLPHPDQPASFPGNFPDEAFWWAGETTLTYPGGSALLVLAHEAAFGSGSPSAGQQIAFGRVRIRATGLTPGAWYRFTHPFGQIDLQATDKGARGVDYTEDAGCTTPPCDDEGFSRVGDSAIGPDFLEWDPAQSAPPGGYIGNPAISHRVIGSRFVAPGETEPANYFRIERIAGRGGPVLDAVGRTDFFLVQGKLAGPPRGRFAAAPAVRFDQRELGSSAEREITVRNTGAAELALGRPRIGGDHAEDFMIDGVTCALPGRLGPGEACTVLVAFAPTTAGSAGRDSTWSRTTAPAASRTASPSAAPRRRGPSHRLPRRRR
jgi:hypothetical protein